MTLTAQKDIPGNFLYIPHLTKVRIKKGAKILSMSKGRYEAKRSYMVLTNGNSFRFEEEICWAGAGGYWCYTHKDNVEIVEEGK